MSQEQPRRTEQEPIKYGDVFSVEGELAQKPVAPVDVAMMQTAENTMLGQTQKGGAAAAMQSAATKTERAGFVDRNDLTDVAGDGCVTITGTEIPGRRIITESIGGEEVKQLRQAAAVETPSTLQISGGAITIGEALEATALTAGKKPVEWSDAAAIQAAEVRATGRTTITPGGVAAAAQSAATRNARVTSVEDKTKLAEILSDATAKLPSDRPATRKDAEGVTGAEMRNDPNLTTHPAGVAASVAAAARLNQKHIEKRSWEESSNLMHPSSPFYLSQSDNPRTKLVSSLLVGENYQTWARSMTNALRAKNKFVFVNGSLTESEVPSAKKHAWEKCNSMVISWIFNSLSKELHDSVAYVDTAREIWVELEERFSQGSGSSRVYQIKRKLSSLNQEDSSIAVYYSKMKSLWDELSIYSKVPKCSCGAGKEFMKEMEEEKVHQFLMGLNEAYSTIRRHILTMEPLPSLDNVYAYVVREERQQMLMETATMNVKITEKRPNKTKEKCEHCGKNGHRKAKCFKFIGYPQPKHGSNGVRQQPTNANHNIAAAAIGGTMPTSSFVGLTKEQYDQLIDLLNIDKLNIAGPSNEQVN